MRDTFFRARSREVLPVAPVSTLKPSGSRIALALAGNPLVSGREHQVQTVDVEKLQSPSVLFRSKRVERREIRDLRRRQSAVEAIHGLTHDNEIYGFTKGQFSLLDLLKACLQVTGPAGVSLSTWTAARHEIQELDRMLKAGTLTSCRWLVDFTFARRDPEAAHQIRQTFGLEAIRVAQNHAKFALFQNADWQLVVRTSMNLNMNPRFEDFTIAHDPVLAGFLDRLLGEIWSRQKRSLADSSLSEIRRYFVDEM